MKSRLKHALTMFCAALLPAQAASAMTVQPVVIDLQTAGREMTQVVTVENTFATPLPVELTVQELELTPDGVKQTGKDPGDLLVFPPQAIIEPGQTQTFRIQYVGDPALARSKHYYVTVAQLPVKLPEGQSAIQILYNFQVLVSIAPAGVKPKISVQTAAIGTNAAGKPVPVLTVTNESPAHGYLANGSLRIVAKDAAGKQVYAKTFSGAEIQQTMGFGLIGGGQTRKVTMPVELPTAEGTVEASFSLDN
ncbi:MAG TPA: fimbria/pilus periplasmic chaperone [Novosphingobium sp.]|nr:fimbria/pilus periplasmic chaperone [Novosphingobium sp.]